MSLVFQSRAARLYAGSCLDVLKELPDNSIDSIVTDPPYGLSNTDPAHVAEALARWGGGERDFIPDGKGFMGKAWDAFVPPPAVWDECLRVLKPGGHLLAFAGSRTFDLMALSIRLAGFEIRDSVAWLYGSGFPKSLDVSKAIDKAAGAERDYIGEGKYAARKPRPYDGGNSLNISQHDPRVGNPLTAPATPEAQQWQGWGTALKPAFEPVVVARKPLIGTVAENVLQFGTGGLNIDGTRIGTETIEQRQATVIGGKAIGGKGVGLPQVANGVVTTTQGRWPANVMLDEYTAGLLDEQSGVSKSSVGTSRSGGRAGGIMGKPVERADKDLPFGYDDKGGASRFFYVAKASKRDRNEGLDGLPEVESAVAHGRDPNSAGARNPRAGIGGGSASAAGNASRKNFHPTVKPTDLMRQLVRLVTPPGGTVLDPFTGSGSTGKAAILEGFQFIGVELTEEYLPIIEGRLVHAEETLQAEIDGKQVDEAETLFSLDDSA